MCHVKTVSVEESLAALEDKHSRREYQQAYNVLMNTPTSSHKAFIDKHNEALETNDKINLYDYSAIEGIECCLWPHLYPYTDLCETTLKENESCLSSKFAFLNKVFSNILDYALTYDLLQFHYDMLIFKMVMGAISSARRMKSSPARALNAKTFSAGYWKTQHRLSVDAVRQFGYPSIFVTINPYKWTFPFPQWLKNVQQLTCCGPTKQAGFETVHIAHTLEQIVCGYLCVPMTRDGTNTYLVMRTKREDRISIPTIIVLNSKKEAQCISTS